MTKDEIIRMARESGGADISSHGWTSWVGTQSTEFLERFAKRVVALAAERERDAIAQMFEASPELVPSAKNDHGGCILCGFDPKMAASAIRARGNT